MGLALTLGGSHRSHTLESTSPPCRVGEGVAQADVRVEGGLAAPDPHDCAAHAAHMPGFQVLKRDVAYRVGVVAAVAPVDLVHPRFGVGAFVFLEPPVEPVAQERGLAGPDPAVLLYSARASSNLRRASLLIRSLLSEPPPFPRGRVGGSSWRKCQ